VVSAPAGLGEGGEGDAPDGLAVAAPAHLDALKEAMLGAVKDRLDGDALEEGKIVVSEDCGPSLDFFLRPGPSLDGQDARLV
jgi:hypothetical protein